MNSMTRFEIQDIVSQNRDGVTFRALDTSTDQIVSLRRFFPFGQGDEDDEGGVGLEPDEGKAFSSACERLSQVQHPALRKTIFGNTDPIDGMPFLVTEWIDGESLSDVLGNNTMDPSMIIGLVRQALDVCMTLSNTLQNEAVWIDTKLEAIIVSNASEVPSFSFRICPFKWLGTQSHQKDLTGIVSMVEALMGWKTKLVSDQAGLGLGGWIKLLRQNPQMPLTQALETLPSPSTTPAPVPATTNLSSKPVQQTFIVTKAEPAFFNKKSVSIMAVSACVTGALIFFFYLQKTKKADDAATLPAGDPAIIQQPSETLEPAKTKENPAPPVQPPAPPVEPPAPPTTDDKPKTTPPTVSSWTPAAIPLAAWYDASNAATISATNGSVSQWKDISGKNEHATQTAGDLQPKTATRKINELNAIDFDVDVLSRAELNMDGKAVFAVVSIDKDGDGGQILAHSKMNHQLRLYGNGQVGYAAAPPRYKDYRYSSYKISAEKPGIIGVIFNKTLEYSVNGMSDDTGIAEQSNVSAAYNQFGARAETSEPLDGLVGEIIITESIPDSDTRQKIEGYLAHKWGLTETLANDHPYKSIVPPSSASKSEDSVKLPPTTPESEKPKPVEPKVTKRLPIDVPAVAWYDATTATINANTVSIANSNGDGNSISGPASLVANGIGNLQAVQFNGSNQYLTGEYANKEASLTAFFIGKSLQTNQQEYAGMMSVWAKDQRSDWDNFSSAVLFSQNQKNPDSIYTHRNGVLSSATAPLTQGFLVATVFDGANNTIYLNGKPSAAVASSQNFNTDKLIVGSRWRLGAVSAPYWNGNFGEAILFNVELNTSDRQKIEGYLANKWGLTDTLPADHPYKPALPAAPKSETVTQNNPSIPKTDKKTAVTKSSPWSPTEVTPLAWYDAADSSTITAKGVKVSQWNDKSGNSNHLKMSQPPYQPAYKKSTVVFGASDRLESDPTKLSNFVGPTHNKAAVFAVIKYHSGTVLMQVETSPSNRLSLEGNSRFDFPNDMAGKLEGWSQPIEKDNYTILAATADGTTQSVHVNGTLAASKPNSLSIKDANGTRLGLGGQPGGGEPSAIEVQELIFVDAVSDEDRRKMEGYLAHKWKLTGNLPADHPYKSTPPTNATPGEMVTNKETMIVTKVFSATPLTYSADVSKSDLLTGLTPVTTGWHTINNASTLELTDGIHGLTFKEVAGDLIQGAFSTVGATAIYNLGTGANGLGYDIASIQSIADWRDSGFGNQAWTLAVKSVDGSDFVDLATVDYQPLAASDGGTTKVTLTDPSGVIAKGVESIKITANSITGGSKNKSFIWRELDVFGTPSSATPQVIDILTPQNTDYIRTLKAGDPVTLQGIVKSAKFSSTGKSIYLSFSDPVVETDIRVVVHENEYVGNAFTEEEFTKLTGKNLVFSGTVYTESFHDRPPFVKITDKNQIKLATADIPKRISNTAKTAAPNAPTPEAANKLITFSPDDFDAIAKLELKTPAAVKGVVKSVKIPKPGSGLYFAFSDPWDGKQIQAVAYPSWFDSKKDYNNEEFKKIEADLQKLVGKTVLFEGMVSTQGNKAKPHFIYISGRDQIKEAK